MSPHPNAPVSVGFVSLGCAKNLVDSEVMAGVLVSEGLALAPSPEQADVILVNTCSFIRDAREESIDAILDACALRDEGACRAVIVAGCLPQRYREQLRESLPEVDAFIGLDSLESIGRVIHDVLDGAHGVLETTTAARRLYEPRLPGLSLSGGPYAYLKIAEGCNHPCAFCAIPAIRGRHRSRAVADLVREAAALLDSGVRELNLISQDTTSYGRDRSDDASLPALLRALADLGDGFRLRLLYGYPSRVTRELLETMAELPQVCHYLDIPVQHSHPDMLKAMKRGNTARSVASLPARARAVMPDIALRTTLLVGFPGETERHVDHLDAYLADTRFDHVGVFTFSSEEGTAAASLPRRPRAATAERRRARLLATQQALVAARGEDLVGTSSTALLEYNEGRRWVARTPRQAPEVDGVTYVTHANADLQSGDIVPVRYTGTQDYDMVARVIPATATHNS